MTVRTAHEAPRAASELSAALRAGSGSGAVRVAVDDQQVDLPDDLLRKVLDLLDDVAAGRHVTSAPSNLPIGTELASELLGVSRPWFTALLDRGVIPSVRVGSKRRVQLGDLLAYRRADDARRNAALTWEFLDEED